ncbi:MAG: 1-deoxy-D-xylulose-5-phosphate reductoisomerase [Pseudomonadota bacterium]
MTVGARPVAVDGAAAPRRVTILGSTGSVGRNTLDVLSTSAVGGAAFEVEALTAYSNVELLIAQAKAFRPRLAVIGEPGLYGALADGLSGTDVAVAAGPDALVEAAERPADFVMAAIVGAAGLKPTLAAAARGAAIGLANKECLVCAGPLLTDAAGRAGATLLPVDSEHNAIFQVFDFDRPDRVRRLILTASGGPFREWSLERMATATRAEAVAHPNWSMGDKISVDSATMMNKGLELIEAAYLFPVAPENIDVLVHPQSVVHSLVEYVDGSVLAQLGAPDMRTPISYALAWPDRMETPSDRLDLAAVAQLTFERPDDSRFPALGLARRALEAGGAATAVLNAANEACVAAFLANRMKFLDIAAVSEQVLNLALSGKDPDTPKTIASMEDVLAADAAGRRLGEAAISSLK